MKHDKNMYIHLMMTVNNKPLWFSQKKILFFFNHNGCSWLFVHNYIFFGISFSYLIIGSCRKCLWAKFTKYDQSTSTINCNDREEGTKKIFSLLFCTVVKIIFKCLTMMITSCYYWIKIFISYLKFLASYQNLFFFVIKHRLVLCFPSCSIFCCS